LAPERHPQPPGRAGDGLTQTRLARLSLSIDLRNNVDSFNRRAYVLPANCERKYSSSPGEIAVNTRRFLFLFLLAAGLILAASPAFAHHSTAEFDMATMTAVKGTVTQFEWSNPHAYILVESKDDKGNLVEWTAELASLGMLSRINWKRDTVKPGDEITIYGNPAKNGKTLMRLEKIAFANGQELSAKVG
jgi:hypothetical protein